MDTLRGPGRYGSVQPCVGFLCGFQRAFYASTQLVRSRIVGGS
jgi:hypothetical protein